MAFKHGLTKTPEYRSWKGMVYRCHTPDSKDYPRYGGRGISVCEEWKDDFPQFLKDMGPRPSLEYTLDRVDNEGDYEPGNCRWATAQEQASNRRNNKRVAYKGEELTLSEWARKSGLAVDTFHRRLASGWDFVACVETPAWVGEARNTPRKLTIPQVVQIRALYASGVLISRIAKSFGVAAPSIRKVVTRVSYAYVNESDYAAALERP